MEPQFTPGDIERFWSRVAKGESSECWPWTRAKNDYGYGLFWSPRHKRFYRAHRVAWLLTHGPIPEEMVVRHKTCDNPPCCNPHHLAVGTHADNVADKTEKGRQLYGERDPKSKLLESEVQDIRNLYASGALYQYQIARVYGVSKGCVRDIIAGVNWSHLKENHHDYATF